MRYYKIDIMDKPKISTMIVIICLLIIGLYAMGEVNYYSAKLVIEKNIDSPKIIIPSIGVDEKINNKSLNQGVLSDPGENVPPNDTVVLYGHRRRIRTLHSGFEHVLNLVKITDGTAASRSMTNPIHREMRPPTYWVSSSAIPTATGTSKIGRASCRERV